MILGSLNEFRQEALDIILHNLYKRLLKEPSHNIIDLIEEKDFFEIEFYSERCKERITKIFQVDYIIEDNICFTNGDCQLNILHGEWSNQDKELNPIIKRVLTHEQFEREAYKV